MIKEQEDSYIAQDLTGKAILYEIGAKSGIVEVLEQESKITAIDLATKLSINNDFVRAYLNIMHNLKLLNKISSDDSKEFVYSKTDAYHIEKNKVGYISWGMVSCAPLIANSIEFIKNFDTAINLYHRDGEHVARTSKWMGEKDFYPHAEDVILGLKPNKVVDLGSGTCGLLIRLAQKMQSMDGIGVDLSEDACNIAKDNIKSLNLDDRLSVIASPIQDLVFDKEVFANADVVHAGFVFHDLLPDDEEVLDQILSWIRHTASPKVTLVIVDAVPFSQESNEMAFSSAFTFLHKFFMGRKLLSETVWLDKLKKSGFMNIHVEKLGISGGRILVANNNIAS